MSGSRSARRGGPSVTERRIGTSKAAQSSRAQVAQGNITLDMKADKDSSADNVLPMNGGWKGTERAKKVKADLLDSKALVDFLHHF